MKGKSQVYTQNSVYDIDWDNHLIRGGSQLRGFVKFTDCKLVGQHLMATLADGRTVCTSVVTRIGHMQEMPWMNQQFA